MPTVGAIHYPLPVYSRNPVVVKRPRQGSNPFPPRISHLVGPRPIHPRLFHKKSACLHAIISRANSGEEWPEKSLMVKRVGHSEYPVGHTGYRVGHTRQGVGCTEHRVGHPPHHLGQTPIYPRAFFVGVEWPECGVARKAAKVPHPSPSTLHPEP